MICLLSVEVSLRSGLITPAFDQGDRDFALDRRVLYKIVPHSGEEINNYGFRDREFVKDKKGKRRILFLGDSFVEGRNVKMNETIPKELEKSLGEGYEVFNMGVQGYGPDQELIRLIDDGLELDPDMIIMGLYPTNDFSDLLRNELFDVGNDGDLVYAGQNSVTRNIPRLHSLYFFEYLLYKYGSDKYGKKYKDIFITMLNDTTDYDIITGEFNAKVNKKSTLMRLILRKAKALAHERNIPLVVVIIPSYSFIYIMDYKKMNSAFIHDDIAQLICRQEGIDAIKLYPQMLKVENPAGLYGTETRHLNPDGTKFVAEEIRRHIEKVYTGFL
ncbi:MAG: SGNH/GDSL hydrolase family protein [Thermodesulfovibrionales bacterium]|nr:SGNH/GDSL hydrolase family protein [Thermodesulfovibrionales bacterium]